MCSTDSSLNLFIKNQTFWQIIVERDYSKYIPAFPVFTNEAKWQELYRHLLSHRIVPIYNRGLLIGYLIVAPTDLLTQFFQFLYRNIGILYKQLDYLPKASINLPILSINSPIRKSHRGKGWGTVHLKIPGLQIKLRPVCYHGYDSTTGKFDTKLLQSSIYYCDQSIANNVKNLYFDMTDQKISQIPVPQGIVSKNYYQDECRLSPLHIEIPSQYNMFNGLEKIELNHYL